MILFAIIGESLGVIESAEVASAAFITKMAFIIAIAIYDGGIDVAVPTFLLGLVVWYGVLFKTGLADADDILGI